MQLKDVPGYEGYYEIREDGAVYSLRSNKWLKPGMLKRRGGKLDPMVILSTNPNDRKTFKIARLVALTFVPNLSNFLQINHIDGNQMNNHFTNLEWCTQSYNIKHAYDNKLMLPQRGRRKNTKGEHNIHKTRNNSWVVQVWHKSKPYNGGTYKDINDAIVARENLITKLEAGL